MRMTIASAVVTLLLALGAFLPVHAAKKAGVTMDDTLPIGDTELVLNGLGLRKRLFIKLYVAGLYVDGTSDDAAAIVEADAPMALQLHMLSKLVSRKKLIEALEDGFDKSTGGNLEPVQAGIDQLIGGMQQKVQPGDRFTLVYEPDSGTRLLRNGDEQVVVEGLPFKQALFGIWLSDKPVQVTLKSALLGG